MAQYLAADREPLPDKPPKVVAERRRKLPVDPDTLYTRLISKDDRLRRETVTRLGESWLAERDLADVRLFAVNLDADPDLERVLVFRSSGLDGAALVAKQENGIWWQLGGFVWGGPGSPHIDQFIELKQTVWLGTNDLIVHSGGPHGTGIGERNLSVYRVWKGHLYRVLQMVESAYNSAGSESSRVTYPDVDSHAPRNIVVDRVKEIGDRRTTECVPYRWDAARFVFVQIPPSRRLCRSGN